MTESENFPPPEVINNDPLSRIIRPKDVDEAQFELALSRFGLLEWIYDLENDGLGISYAGQRRNVVNEIKHHIRSGVLPKEAEVLLTEMLPQAEMNDPNDPYNPNPDLQIGGWRE